MVRVPRELEQQRPADRVVRSPRVSATDALIPAIGEQLTLHTVVLHVVDGLKEQEAHNRRPHPADEGDWTEEDPHERAGKDLNGLGVKHQVAPKMSTQSTALQALSLDSPCAEPSPDDGAEPERVQDLTAAGRGRIVWCGHPAMMPSVVLDGEVHVEAGQQETLTKPADDGRLTMPKLVRDVDARRAEEDAAAEHQTQKLPHTRDSGVQLNQQQSKTEPAQDGPDEQDRIVSHDVLPTESVFVRPSTRDDHVDHRYEDEVQNHDKNGGQSAHPQPIKGGDGEDEGKHIDPGTHGDLTSFNIEQSLCNPKVSLLASRRSLEAAIIPPLNDEQVANYWRDGHLAGIDILTPEQTSLAYQRLAKLEAQEIAEDADRWASEEHQPWQHAGSPWWHWFMGMTTHPTIIAAVGQLLGPNVMIRNADIFVKGPRASKEIRWHTDTTASTEEAGRMLTAWLALTDSTVKNGCLQWATGSHEVPLPPEVKDKHSLALSPESFSLISDLPKVPNIVRPGQLSLHHFRTIHRSGGNVTHFPRVGLVIRFMACDASPEAAESGTGILVSGENRPGHFGISKQLRVSWSRSTRSQLSTR